MQRHLIAKFIIMFWWMQNLHLPTIAPVIIWSMGNIQGHYPTHHQRVLMAWHRWQVTARKIDMVVNIAINFKSSCHLYRCSWQVKRIELTSHEIVDVMTSCRESRQDLETYFPSHYASNVWLYPCDSFCIRRSYFQWSHVPRVDITYIYRHVSSHKGIDMIVPHR
jgi:hypothetical protein